MFQTGLYYFGRTVVSLGAAALFQLDVQRHVELPAGPKIIAPNHPTTTDPFLILTLLREPITILISETLFKVPGFGRYLQLAGHVPVVHSHGQPAFEAARQLLEAGKTVAIFPEGAISPLDGGFAKAHTGVARLALQTDVPVIPVGIGLLHERIKLIETLVDGRPEIGTWYFGGPYALTTGEPLRFTGNVDDRAYVRTITDRLMQRIAYLAGESDRRLAARNTVVAQPA
jgi:1-acyl-sn-glycerol-3-phosphate acyltransferase